MRSHGYTFRDIAGRLSMIRLECEKCGRAGRYNVAKLIDQWGMDASLSAWRDSLTADCPKRKANQPYDLCGAKFPGLPGLFLAPRNQRDQKP